MFNRESYRLPLAYPYELELNAASKEKANYFFSPLRSLRPGLWCFSPSTAWI
ncbi:MAG: hypothetical protein K9M57_08155 [Phycisphaerae bacterium]|nr:hypothetical protein [Phycisphaerae bacterium]